MQTGLIDKWSKASSTENGCQAKPDSPHPFGLTNIKSAVLVLFIGLGLAGGALIIECMCYENRQH